ncbi:MAG: cell division protein FtsZ [Flavobacteriaceae bacterium]|nr:cell division protein FtsZ [Flavobacteriaceae bacterium]
MEDNIDIGINFDLPKNRSNVIKAIGVGGGGSNAINHMFKQGIKGVDFVICNTDAQALNNSGVPNKIQLGVNLTEGLGAGANPDIGKQAALESCEDIIQMLQTNTKMVFITAGMGGGTGTGAAPIIAKMARELNILTVGIVTTPFEFEGKIRNEQAQIGLENLREHVDSLIIINNNKLRDVYGNLGFKAGFSKADEVLSTASKGIAEVITHHYTQNIDLKDAKTVLSNSGTAIMGAYKSSGENRAKEAISKALESPLLNDNKIFGAKNVLLLIVSGTNEITIDEIGEINDYIQDEAGNGANIIMGVGEDNELNDSISVTVIATGFDSDQQNQISNTEPQKIIHKLEEENLFSQLHIPEHKTIPIDEQNLEENIVDEKKVEENDLELTNSEKIVHVLEMDEYEDQNILDEDDYDFETKESSFDDLSCTSDDNELLNGSMEDKNNENLVEWSLFEKGIEEENKEDEILIDNSEKLKFDEGYVEFESKLNNSKENNSIESSNKKNDVLPEENSISDFQKLRSEERRLRMKEFNYKFNKSKINDINDEPAFKRKGIDIDEVNNSEQQNISRTSLSEDESNEVKIRKNNSFLHDNVD